MIWISLSVSPGGPVCKHFGFVAITARHRTDNSSILGPMMTHSITHACDARPQCVKASRFATSDHSGQWISSITSCQSTHSLYTSVSSTHIFTHLNPTCMNTNYSSVTDRISTNYLILQLNFEAHLNPLDVYCTKFLITSHHTITKLWRKVS